jgi:rubrerythrin
MDRMSKLFEIFQEAVEAERQAQERYLDAARSCDDPELKQVLLAFAEDEKRHEQEIQVRVNELAQRLGRGIH